MIKILSDVKLPKGTIIGKIDLLTEYGYEVKQILSDLNLMRISEKGTKF